MDIPPKLVFESFIAATAWSEPKDWRIRFRANAESEVESIKGVLREIYEARNKHWDDLCKHELLLWLESQPNFMRGWEVGGRKRPRNAQSTGLEYFIEYHLESITRPPSQARQALIDKGKIEHVSHELWTLWRRKPASSAYIGMIVQAYYDYFYSEKWIDIAVKAKTFRSAISNAYTALEALKRYENIIDTAIYKTAFSRLEMLNSHKLEVIHFIKRNDQTVKERGLVYDLAHANHFLSRKPMPSKIFFFLGIDGIVNPLDPRTIERIVEKIPTFKR